MNETVLTILLAVVASSGVWSVVLAIVNARIKKREKLLEADSAERAMLLALAHDRIYFLCTRYLKEFNDGKRKGISKEEWENLSILFDGYQKLGGNGTCERLFGECEDMPTLV